MRKFINFPDGRQKEITPLEYREFCNLELWTGASDMAYDMWMRKNNLVELSCFRDEALATAFITIKLESRNYLFNVEELNMDSDKWLDYDLIKDHKPILRFSLA